MTFAVIVLLSLWLVAMTCVAITQTVRLRWQMIMTDAWKAGAESWEAVAKRWEEVANDELDAAIEAAAEPAQTRPNDAFVWFDNSAKMDRPN